MSAHRIFLTGTDTLAIDERLQILLSGYRKKYGEEIESIDGETCTFRELQEMVGSASLFSQNRCVVLKNFPLKAQSKSQLKDKEAEVLSLFERVSEETILIAVHSKPDKRKKLFKTLKKEWTFEEKILPTGKMLDLWFEERVKGLLSSRDCSEVVQQVGEDPMRLGNIATQIHLYSEGKQCTLKEILPLLGAAGQGNIFGLTDALGTRNLVSVMTHWKNLCEGGDDVYMVLAMLIRHVRLLLALKSSEAPSNLATSLKLHPFVAKKTMAQCKGFSKKELQQLFEKLLEIDHGVKTGAIRISGGDMAEMEQAIEMVFMNACGSL